MSLNWDTFWTALALMFIMEGLFPLLAPSRWRAMFEQVTQLQDGQVRFFGLMAMCLGLFLMWLLWA